MPLEIDVNRRLRGRRRPRSRSAASTTSPARLKPSTLVPADGTAPHSHVPAPVYHRGRTGSPAEDIGFAEVECFGDLDGRELSHESRLAVRARKAGRMTDLVAYRGRFPDPLPAAW